MASLRLFEFFGFTKANLNGHVTVLFLGSNLGNSAWASSYQCDSPHGTVFGKNFCHTQFATNKSPHGSPFLRNYELRPTPKKRLLKQPCFLRAYAGKKYC